jgi:hypothetical protein
MNIVIKSILYLITFDDGVKVEIKETNGLLDYIKPLNGPVGTIFYLDFNKK